MEYLTANRVNVRLRRSRGKDIDAACGQLANVDKGAELTPSPDSPQGVNLFQEGA
jgi:hypothetical protein